VDTGQSLPLSDRMPETCGCAMESAQQFLNTVKNVTLISFFVASCYGDDGFLVSGQCAG